MTMLRKFIRVSRLHHGNIKPFPDRVDTRTVADLGSDIQNFIFASGSDVVFPYRPPAARTIGLSARSPTGLPT